MHLLTIDSLNPAIVAAFGAAWSLRTHSPSAEELESWSAMIAERIAMLDESTEGRVAHRYDNGAWDIAVPDECGPELRAAFPELAATFKVIRKRDDALLNEMGGGDWRSDAERAEHASRDEQRRRWATAARDPDTNVTLLVTIAQLGDPLLQGIVASHPRLPHDTLHALFNSGDLRVLSGIAANPMAPTPILESMLLLERPGARSVLATAATNPSLPVASVRARALGADPYLAVALWESLAGRSDNPERAQDVLQLRALSRTYPLAALYLRSAIARLTIEEREQIANESREDDDPEYGNGSPPRHGRPRLR